MSKLTSMAHKLSVTRKCFHDMISSCGLIPRQPYIAVLSYHSSKRWCWLQQNRSTIYMPVDTALVCPLIYYKTLWRELVLSCTEMQMLSFWWYFYHWLRCKFSFWQHRQCRKFSQIDISVLVCVIPESKVHGANTGPIRGRQDPGGPHVGPMNFAI